MKFYLKKDIQRGSIIPKAWIWHGNLGRNGEYGIQIRLPWWIRKQKWDEYPGVECTHQLVLRIHKDNAPETYQFLFVPDD